MRRRREETEQALQQFDGKHQPPTPLHRVLVRTQQQLQAQQQQAQLTSELPLSSLLLSRRPAEVRLFGRESWPAELACVCECCIVAEVIRCAHRVNTEPYGVPKPLTNYAGRNISSVGKALRAVGAAKRAMRRAAA